MVGLVGALHWLGWVDAIMAEVVRSTIAVHIFHLRNPTDQKNRYYSSVLSNNRNISLSSSSFDIKKGGALKDSGAGSPCAPIISMLVSQ